MDMQEQMEMRKKKLPIGIEKWGGRICRYPCRTRYRGYGNYYRSKVCT